MWLQLIRDLSVLVATPCFSSAWTDHDGFSGPETRLILVDPSPTVHQLKSWYLDVPGTGLYYYDLSILFGWTYPLFQDFCSTFAHFLVILPQRFWNSWSIDIGSDIRGRFWKFPETSSISSKKGSQGPKGFFLEIVVLNLTNGFIHSWSL